MHKNKILTATNIYTKKKGPFSYTLTRACLVDTVTIEQGNGRLMCSSVLFWVNLWSRSQLWAAKWLLGIEPSSSGRAASAFLQPCKFIFLSLFLSSVKRAHCSHSTGALFCLVFLPCVVLLVWVMMELQYYFKCKYLSLTFHSPILQPHVPWV